MSNMGFWKRAFPCKSTRPHMSIRENPHMKKLILGFLISCVRGGYFGIFKGARGAYWVFTSGVPSTGSWSPWIYCLGGEFKIHKTQEGLETFTFCAKTYLSNVCDKIEKLMNITLMKFEVPMATSDHPGTDDTCFHNNDDHSKCRMLIGCSQWSITLGRLDVLFAVQTMARFSASPKEGHLRRMLRFFWYLKGYT